jgi:predicted SAM-dependent methyltransferase
VNRRITVIVHRSPALYHAAKTVQSSLLGLRRIWWRRQSRGAIKRYFESYERTKLELGAGQLSCLGWLNTDLEPARASGSAPAVIYLDATRQFPFEDDTFEYIRSEHMIEHLSYDAARAMLIECCRVMRRGGRIRIATPDLARLVALYYERDHLSPEQDHYVRWIAEEFMDKSRATPQFVVNNAFRAWGHEFLFDEETLTAILCEAGFTEVRRYEVGESDDPELIGSERHMCATENAAANEFETMVLEARKGA